MVKQEVLGATLAAIQAFGDGDLRPSEEIFHPDIVWHFPGTGDLAGVHRGRQAVLKMLRELQDRTEGTTVVEPVDLLVGEDRLMMFTRSTFTKNGEEHVHLNADAIRYEDDKWREFWMIPSDREDFDVLMH